MKKNAKYYLKLIDKIEKIRGKNNVNWMNILRLSFKIRQEKLLKFSQTFTKMTKG